MEVFFGSCQGTDFYGPEKGAGEVSYSVNWSFGDVKPIVQIWRDEEDITDQTVDVMIGRKVKLKTKVFPEGLEAENGRWEIEGDIIADYVANIEEARVERVEEEAFDRPEIEYYYTSGSYSFNEKPVKYRCEVDGKKIEAETTFSVYQPEVGNRSIHSSDVNVGHYGGSCDLYLGSVDPASDPPKGAPGMLIRHEILMPFADNDDHLLQYVQLINEDMLEHHDRYYYRQRNDNDCLDTKYPANSDIMDPAPWRVEFQDTPAAQLRGLTHELHQKMDFENYLMFKPSADKDDPEAIWIPVELNRWNWAGGVRRIAPQSEQKNTCDTTSFDLVYDVPPERNITPEPWPEHPEWNCNARDTKREPVFDSQEKETWEEDLQKLRERGEEGP